MCENTMVSGISTPLLCAQLLSHVRLFVIPWIAALQAPLSMAFSRQEYQFSPVQSLSRVRLFWPHGWQQARLPCSSSTAGAYSNSHPSSRWCHPTISSSVVPFSSCLQSFAASGAFPISWFFESGGQSTGVSASASVLPMDIQDWFSLGWTDLISLSGLPFPSPGDLPDPGTERWSPALQADPSLSEPPGKPLPNPRGSISCIW